MLANRNQRVWQVVAAIPRGQVATYGQIGALAGLLGPTAARQVGYALAALGEGSGIPWHRVVNAAGRISTRTDPERPGTQRDLLAAEGVDFGLTGDIDLTRFRWRPADA